MSKFDTSLLELLKSEPSIGEIDRITTLILNERHDFNLSTNLQVIICYLKYIILVYPSLNGLVKLKVRKLFHSTTGISNLINQHKLSGKNQVYLKFIKDLLVEESFLVDVIKSSESSKSEILQIKGLFFGSKIFQTFEGELDLEKYSKLIIKQLFKTYEASQIYPEFILSFLSLHPIESKIYLFDEFLLNKSHFNYLQDVFKSMSLFQKKQLVIKYLLPYLSMYTNEKNLRTTSKIIYRLQLEDLEESVAKFLSTSDNIQLQQAVIYTFQSKKQHIVNLLELWGNEQYIKDESVIHQENLTIELLCLSNYLNLTESLEISKDYVFLNAITQRLSSNDTRKRSFGMILAKCMTNGQVKYEADDDLFVEKVDDFNLDSSIDFSELKLAGEMESLSLAPRKETRIVDSDDDDNDDDDDEDDTEDETEPVFLKDLIKQLSSEKSTSLTRLLSITNKLVRQKVSFKLEVEFYSKELISVLIGLVNRYEESNFDELKLNAMVGVIVTNPQIITYVIELFLTGDYSLQQRMMILSSISLSARELRGFDDKVIDKPQSDFPTRQLNSRKPLVQEVNVPKIQELKDNEVQEKEQKDLFRSGKITRISSKLTKTQNAAKVNNFAKIAPKFFYPLANAWIQGINIGSHTELFLKHYIQTLDLLIDAANPCYGFEDMLQLYAEIKENSQNVII